MWFLADHVSMGIQILDNDQIGFFLMYEGGKIDRAPHTGLPVPVFANGVNADVFNGYYDNTDIFNKLANMLRVS